MNNAINIAIGVFLGCMAAVFVTSSVLNKSYDNKITALQETHTIAITELEAEKEAVQYYADSVDIVLAQYKALVDSFKIVDLDNQADIDRLEMELKTALAEVVEASYDDNYEWLQNQFPTKDSLEYPFAGEQVSKIAVELIEGEYVGYISDKQKKTIIALRKQMSVSDETIETLYRDRAFSKAITDQLYLDLEAKENELLQQGEDVETLRKAKRVWQFGAIGGASFIFLALLLL